MRWLYFIRHGEPDFPEGVHLCLGRTELPLSERGKAQARAAARAFRDRHLPLFSSPQQRAMETARAFPGPVTAVPGLRERDMGQWDGLSFHEIRARFPRLYAARGEDPSLLPPGAEDEGTVRARFAEALEVILRSCPGDAIVVTHSGVLSAYFGIKKPDYGEMIPVCFEEQKGGEPVWIGFRC